jgi:hypothetical protein
VVSWCAAFLLVLVPVTAAAQFTVVRQASPRPSRGVEFGVSGLAGAPVSFGRRSADLLRPDGGTLSLFTTENRQGPELGIAAHVAGPVRSAFFAEISAALSRATLQTTIDDDFEDAASVTLDEQFFRFSVEGGLGWNITRSEQSAIFVRGTGGWMRELVGSSVLGHNGAVANAGVGMKYWARRPAPGRLRYGLRVEAHLAARWNGVALNTRKVHLAPVVTAGLIIGS